MFEKIYTIIKKKTSSEIKEAEGFVRLSMVDSATGEILDIKKLRMYAQFFNNLKFDKNTSTLGSRKALAHNFIPNDDQYKITRVEWGHGNEITERSNTDLSGPFTPAVYTNLTGYSLVTPEENVLKVTTTLTTETLSMPPGSQYPFIREVALRTNPTLMEPKGLMTARFVADADIPKTTDAIYIGLEWLIIFN